MLVPERRDAIMSYLKEKHSVSVTELSRKLYISETSIRRDLSYLEKKGLLRKTYGGAILVTGENQLLSLSARTETEKEAKILIAQKAVSLIRDGDVLFFDSSSTCLAMIPFIRDFSSLVIVTNGAKAALALVELPFVRVYSTGGLLHPNIYSYSGPNAHKVIEKIQANKCFISPKGLDKVQGAFCTSEDEAAIRRAMIQHSQETILLCAGKKLSKQAAFHLCSLDEINTLVLDEAPDATWAAQLHEHSVQVL